MEELRALRGGSIGVLLQRRLGVEARSRMRRKAVCRDQWLCWFGSVLEVGDANGRIFCDGEKKIQSGR